MRATPSPPQGAGRRDLSWWVDNPPGLDDWLARHDTPAAFARPVGKFLLAVVRTLVFLAGAFWGLAGAYVGGSFGAWAIALPALALTTAAPVCWYFALRGKAGDWWTLAYLGAWAAVFGIGHLSRFVNDQFGPF